MRQFLVNFLCSLFAMLLAVNGIAQIVPVGMTHVLDYNGGQGTYAGNGYAIDQYPTGLVKHGRPVYGLGLITIAAFSEPNVSFPKNDISSYLYPDVISNVNCSVGDPSSDGTNLAFLVQSNATDLSGSHNCDYPSALYDTNPGDAAGFGFGVCRGPMDATFTMTSSNCAVIVPLTSTDIANNAGYVDPVLMGTDLFITHRLHGSLGGYHSTQWEIDHYTVDFASLTATLVSNVTPGTWSGAVVANDCEQFYKATSAYKNASNQWIVFTQADQVNYAGTGVVVGNNTLDGGASNCVALGATETQSGGFSYNEVNPSVLTQRWPESGASLVTSDGKFNSKGYVEFPEFFQYRSTSYLVYISQTGSPDAAVSTCATLSRCAPNFDNEITILNLATNVGTTTTNFFTPETDLNTTYFNGAPATKYGGTSRLNVNPAVTSFLFNMRNSNGVSWLVEFPLVYADGPVQ